jgi:hypothetical protein
MDDLSRIVGNSQEGERGQLAQLALICSTETFLFRAKPFALPGQVLPKY